MLKSVEYQIKVQASKGSNVVKSVSLTESDTISVGRLTNPADANLTTAIKFDSKVISRKHAIFAIVDQKLCVKDTASSSGTFLNRQRLSSQGEESDFVELLTGDEIELGEDCDVDGVMFECVHMKLTISKTEGELKTPLPNNGSPVPRVIWRNSFIRLRGGDNLSVQIQQHSSPSLSSPNAASPAAINQNSGKWTQIRTKVDAGTKAKSYADYEGDDNYGIDPKTGKPMLTQESEEITPEQTEELNQEFENLWSGITNGLDGKICRYLKLAQPYAEMMKSAGVVGENIAVMPKKYVLVKKEN